MTTERPDELINTFEGEFLTNHGWETYIATITQGVSVTFTPTYVRYIVLANLVIVQARVAITSAGTGNNAIVIGGIPASIQAGNTPSNQHVIGTALIENTGSAFYQGALLAVGAADWRIIAHNETGFVGTSPNFALADGDFIGWQASFER